MGGVWPALGVALDVGQREQQVLARDVLVFERLGLAQRLLQDRVELRRDEPATESLVVHVGAADRRIARRAAAEVFVRVTGGALAR